MASRKEALQQIGHFVNWVDGICQEEQVDAKLLDRYKQTLTWLNRYESIKGIMPSGVADSMDAMAKTFFLQGAVGRLGFSMSDYTYEEFLDLMDDLYVMIQRFKENRITTLSSGIQVTEGQRLFNNLKFIEVFVKNEVERYAPTDTPPEKIQELIDAFTHIELQQSQLIESAAQKIESDYLDQHKQASHLTARQKRRRGLTDLKPPAGVVPPRSDNKHPQDQEQECSSSTSEQSSTSQESPIDHE